MYAPLSATGYVRRMYELARQREDAAIKAVFRLTSIEYRTKICPYTEMLSFSELAAVLATSRTRISHTLHGHSAVPRSWGALDLMAACETQGVDVPGLVKAWPDRRAIEHQMGLTVALFGAMLGVIAPQDWIRVPDRSTAERHRLLSAVAEKTAMPVLSRVLGTSARTLMAQLARREKLPRHYPEMCDLLAVAHPLIDLQAVLDQGGTSDRPIEHVMRITIALCAARTSISPVSRERWIRCLQ